MKRRADGRKVMVQGYIRIYVPNHPRADVYGYVFEHIFKAETALGKSLPEKAEVHHHDENPGNNPNSNLVICQDRAYHRLLHVRMRVIKAGGDPNLEKFCTACKRLKSKIEFGKHYAHHEGLNPMCKLCAKEQRKKYPSYRRSKRKALLAC